MSVNGYSWGQLHAVHLHARMHGSKGSRASCSDQPCWSSDRKKQYEAIPGSRYDFIWFHRITMNHWGLAQDVAWHHVYPLPRGADFHLRKSHTPSTEWDSEVKEECTDVFHDFLKRFGASLIGPFRRVAHTCHTCILFHISELECTLKTHQTSCNYCGKNST